MKVHSCLAAASLLSLGLSLQASARDVTIVVGDDSHAEVGSTEPDIILDPISGHEDSGHGSPGVLLPEHGRTYLIVSAFSGKCLDVKDHSFNHGALVQQWECHGGGNQQFKLESAYKFGWKVTPAESGIQLRLAHSSRNNGVSLVQSNYVDDQAHNGYFHFIPTARPGVFTIYTQQPYNNKCLDIDGPSQHNGAYLHQWDCYSNYSSQEWILIQK